uniref:BTB domain-containing protein n=1 Tax=Anopheles funestus TaxID=62324 RepID=A0A182R749_ANOFN
MDRIVRIHNTQSVSKMFAALQTMRVEEYLVDVSIKCEKRTIRAHKLVLSLGSRFFKNTFRDRIADQVTIVLDNILYEDMVAIVDMMYTGIARVKLSQLKTLLAAAESLEVKGFNDLRQFLTDDGFDFERFEAISKINSANVAAESQYQQQPELHTPTINESVPTQPYQSKPNQISSTVNDDRVVQINAQQMASYPRSASANLPSVPNLLYYTNEANPPRCASVFVSNEATPLPSNSGNTFTATGSSINVEPSVNETPKVQASSTINATVRNDNGNIVYYPQNNPPFTQALVTFIDPNQGQVFINSAPPLYNYSMNPHTIQQPAFHAATEPTNSNTAPGSSNVRPTGSRPKRDLMSNTAQRHDVADVVVIDDDIEYISYDCGDDSNETV